MAKNWSILAARIIDVCLAGRSTATSVAYRKDLGCFAGFAAQVSSLPAGVRAGGAAPDRPLSPSEALAHLLRGGPKAAWELATRYKGHLRDACAANTANRRLASLRAFVRTAYEMGMIGWTLEVRGLRVHPYRDTRGPGRDAVRAMLAAARERRDRVGLRDATILWLLYALALRRNEIAELDLCHVDQPAARISVLGKGRTQREWRELPMPVLHVLQEWILARGPKAGPLFLHASRAAKPARISGQGLYWIVRRLGKAVGKPSVSPHQIRHTAITDAISAGRSTLDVQRFSRHADARVLSIYDDNGQGAAAEISDLLAQGLEGDK